MSSIHSNPSFQLLLSTAEQLIAEKGCRSTTLQDIISRSGLSKGAIYHYVQSKDELFCLLLQSKLDAVNDQFNHAVEQSEKPDLHNPVAAITRAFMREPNDVANLIFVYLLSQKDQPKIARLLQELYDKAVSTSEQWIRIGQRHGVIPPTVEPRKTAALFITFSYGMRVQAMVAPGAEPIAPADFFQLLNQSLKA